MKLLVFAHCSPVLEHSISPFDFERVRHVGVGSWSVVDFIEFSGGVERELLLGLHLIRFAISTGD